MRCAKKTTKQENNSGCNLRSTIMNHTNEYTTVYATKENNNNIYVAFFPAEQTKSS